MKKLFYDLETTGLSSDQNAIHQIAGIVEIDGEVVQEFNLKCKPFAGAVIEPRALMLCNVTLEQINSYQPMPHAYNELISILESYVDRYDRRDKFHAVGYNNRAFDDIFLRSFFERNGDQYFGSWFWPDSQDVIVLASWYLEHKRAELDNFKLGTVAQALGIRVIENELHDALYDVRTTKKIYDIIKGLKMML